MNATYASDTSVSVEKTRAEIETVLSRYGATRFGYMTAPDKAMIGFVFNGRAVKFELPLPNQSAPVFTIRSYIRNGVRREAGANPPDVAYRLWEQACRSRWRSLGLCIKAKLEACASGITTFEKEFLAQFVTPDGKTVGDQIVPQLEAMSRNGRAPQLQLDECQPNE